MILYKNSMISYENICEWYRPINIFGLGALPDKFSRPIPKYPGLKKRKKKEKIAPEFLFRPKNIVDEGSHTTFRAVNPIQMKISIGIPIYPNPSRNPNSLL